MTAIAALCAPTPTRPFFNFCCKQSTFINLTLGPPLRHAWVALRPPLGHPRVTQSQTQSQTQSAEGRKPPISRALGSFFANYKEPITQVPLVSSFCCQRSFKRTTFSLWSESLTLPFVRFQVKRKNAASGGFLPMTNQKQGPSEAGTSKSIGMIRRGCEVIVCWRVGIVRSNWSD